MRTIKTFSLSCLILSAVIFSCRKTSPGTPVSGTDSTLHINLTYQFRQGDIIPDSLTNYELVISESNGKILLDTVTDYNKPVVTDLKTSQSLLDVSVIYTLGKSPNNRLIATTYKAVAPSTWKTLPGSDSLPGQITTPFAGIGVYNATLTYTHDGIGNQFDLIVGDGHPAVYHSFDGNNLTFSYYHDNNSYAYLKSAQLGLYNFHHITSLNDTVDISRPDTSVLINYSRQAEYTNLYTDIAIYPDTTDLSQRMSINTGSSLANLVYPGRKNGMKYDLNVSVSNDAGTNFANRAYNYVDVAPATITLPDETWYTLSSTQPNNVSVSFVNKPTYYVVNSLISSAPVYNWFKMVIPGDSTNVHPLSALAVLKGCQKLKGLDLTAITINDFDFDVFPGFDYQSEMTREADVTRSLKKPIPSAYFFTHYF